MAGISLSSGGWSGSCGAVCPRQTGQVGSPTNGDRPKPVPLRRNPEANTENTHSNVNRSAWTSSTTTSATTAIDTPCAQGLPRTASPKTEKTAADAAVSISSHRMEYCGISICVDCVRRKRLSSNELEYSFAGRSVPTADWGVPCAAGQAPGAPYVSLANTPAAEHPSRRAVTPGAGWPRGSGGRPGDRIEIRFAEELGDNRLRQPCRKMLESPGHRRSPVRVYLQTLNPLERTPYFVVPRNLPYLAATPVIRTV